MVAWGELAVGGMDSGFTVPTLYGRPASISRVRKRPLTRAPPPGGNRQRTPGRVISEEFLPLSDAELAVRQGFEPWVGV